MNSSRELKSGIFIISSLILLIGLLFFFGLSDIFVDDAKIETLFDESVQGLDVGSAVKYRGVQIGSVSKISISVPDNLITVEMKVDYSKFISKKENQSKPQRYQEFVKYFNEQLKEGLRCRLEYAGITGMRYIDFDYYAPKGETSANSKILSEDILFIPAEKSTLNDILDSINISLEKISSLDVAAISSGVKKNLENFDKLITDPNISSAILQINESASNLRSSTDSISKVLSEKRLSELIDMLEKDLKIIETIGNNIDTTIKDSQLPKSTRSFRDAADFVVESKDSLMQTLRKLNAALGEVEEFVRYLNEDPGALVHGKSKR